MSVRLLCQRSNQQVISVATVRGGHHGTLRSPKIRLQHMPMFILLLIIISCLIFPALLTECMGWVNGCASFEINHTSNCFHGPIWARLGSRVMFTDATLTLTTCHSHTALPYIYLGVGSRSLSELGVSIRWVNDKRHFRPKAACHIEELRTTLSVTATQEHEETVQIVRQ
jgi:hypothetical protein